MSGLSGIHTHQVDLVKPEMFSVSGVKDILYDECDPAEECFTVCIAHVQRRKHGSVKIHTMHHCFLPHITSQSQNFLCSSCYFLLLLCLLSHLFCDMWRVLFFSLLLEGRLHFYRPSFDHTKCYPSPIFPICPKRKHWKSCETHQIFSVCFPKSSAAVFSTLNMQV